MGDMELSWCMVPYWSCRYPDNLSCIAYILLAGQSAARVCLLAPSSLPHSMSSLRKLMQLCLDTCLLEDLSASTLDEFLSLVLSVS